MSAQTKWTPQSLMAALLEREGAKYQIEASEDALAVTMLNYENLPVAIGFSGPYMVFKTDLLPASDVKDKHEFHEIVLRCNEEMPATSVSLSKRNGVDHYSLIAGISAYSTIEDVELDLNTLSSNVFELIEVVLEDCVG